MEALQLQQLLFLGRARAGRYCRRGALDGATPGKTGEDAGHCSKRSWQSCVQAASASPGTAAGTSGTESQPTRIKIEPNTSVLIFATPRSLQLHATAAQAHGVGHYAYAGQHHRRGCNDRPQQTAGGGEPTCLIP